MDVPKRLVHSLVLHFSRLAGFEGTVRVTLDVDEFERIRKRRGYTTTISHKDYGAAIAGPRPVVLVNPARHRSWAAIVDTCAHEALHVVAGPEHPDDFYDRVKKLLRNQEP